VDGIKDTASSVLSLVCLFDAYQWLACLMTWVPVYGSLPRNCLFACLRYSGFQSLCHYMYIYIYTHDVLGGKVSILGGHRLLPAILSKILDVYMCPIPNGFRDRALSLYSRLYTIQTSNTPCPHTSYKVYWCWRRNFRKWIILRKLYQLCHWNDTILETVRNVSFLSTILELYSEIAQSQKAFAIGHMYIYTPFS
jgi:hypothetical protein